MTEKKSKRKIHEITIDQVIQDDRNFNIGNEKGDALIQKSIDEFGAGRSILLDKNDRIIAGNKTQQKFKERGGKKIIVVETSGDELVAVKRTDIDLDSAKGREMALADNATAKANIVFDLPMIETVAQEFNIDPEKWNIKMPEIGSDESGDQAQITQQFFLNIECDDERHAQELYERFLEQGLKVKIVT